MKDSAVEQHLRVVDMGKYNLGVGVIHRGRLAAHSGTLHVWTEIPDEVAYLSVRPDQDRVLPLRQSTAAEESTDSRQVTVEV